MTKVFPLNRRMYGSASPRGSPRRSSGLRESFRFAHHRSERASQKDAAFSHDSPLPARISKSPITNHAFSFASHSRIACWA